MIEWGNVTSYVNATVGIFELYTLSSHRKHMSTFLGMQLLCVNLAVSSAHKRWRLLLLFLAVLGGGALIFLCEGRGGLFQVL